MPEPKHSIDIFSRNVAGVAISVGDVVIPNASDETNYVVATSANRGTRGSEGVALTPVGGNKSAPFEMQTTGILDPEISGLATAGAKSLVRVSTAGRLERVSPGDPNTDDIVGWAELSGRCHLFFGLPIAAIIALAGGGGGGAPTDASYVTLGTSSGLSNERVLTAGTNIETVDGGAGQPVTINLDPPAAIEDDVFGSDGAGGLKNLGPFPAVPTPLVITNNSTGSQTGVPTTSGGDDATAILFTNGSGVTVHGLAGGTDGRELTLVSSDGNVILTYDSGTEGTAANRIICPAGEDYELDNDNGVKLVWETTTDRWRVIGRPAPDTISVSGTGLVTATSGIINSAASLGSANFVSTTNNAGTALEWRALVNANVSASAAIVASKLAPPGSTTQGIYNSSGAFAADSGFTYDGSGTITTTTSVRAPFFGPTGTLPATGLLRVPFNAGSQDVVRGFWSSGNEVGIINQTGSTTTFGDITNATLNLYGFAVDLWGGGGGLDIFSGVSGAATIRADGATLSTALPVAGSSADSRPLRLKLLSVNDGSTSADYTLLASEYSTPLINLVGSYSSTSKDVIFPNSSGGVWRVKTISSRQLKISGQTGVTLAAGKARWVMCNGTDIEFMEVP